MKKKLALPSDLTFGIFFISVFFLSSLYFFFMKINYLSLILGSITFYFILITIFKSNQLSKLNFYWFKLGIFIGKIISPIILGIIFYFIISPVAIILRLAGRDELSIKKNNHTSSWKKRDVEVYQKDNFYNQY